ncbi:MAG: hypothetical protein KF745_02850 [Phycisphaeraceae bacterium]|nr:hypothetical protein [Phycisphaeraceae bacterium]
MLPRLFQSIAPRRLTNSAQAVAYVCVCPSLMPPPLPDWEWILQAGRAALDRGLELLRLRRRRP